jgi:hypothetical protein
VSTVVKILDCVAGGNLTADTSGSLTNFYEVNTRHYDRF